MNSNCPTPQNENNLATVWPYVEAMLDNGISLIPVRDKEQLYNGSIYPAKTPCLKDWKRYQSTPPTKQELWHNTEKANTTAFAMICGKVSGNLFIIDIDVKYKDGVDATLFSDLNALYPSLFQRLRIHRTPSGGYHIIYRILGDKVPGNEKLASRMPTEEELAADPTKTKPKAFIETRGEGGYAVAPPSLGYTLHQHRPIPDLTWEEHSSIVNLCRSYNEVIKVEKAPKPTQYESNYYSENPWEHFNNSPAAEEVLTNHGWKFKSQSNQFIWFTRPGKDQGVSASWNKTKRIYYIFTSSTEFEPSTGYQASTALAILMFGGDKKKTHSWLVNNGYGKVRPEVEQRMIKAKATRGGELPANISDTARQALEVEVTRIKETYPYGVFWVLGEDSKIHISREKLYRVAEGLGYRLHNGVIVQIVGKIIYKRGEREFFDDLKSYIQEEEYEVYERIANALEAFFQKSGKFTVSRLPMLDTRLLWRDEKKKCLKFYQNGYVEITPDAVTFNPYDNITWHVFKDNIQDRDYIQVLPGFEGLYRKLIKHAIPSFVVDPIFILMILGYLCHEYKDEATGKIIILTEICEDPRLGGGSGKNVFCNLLKYSTTYISIPGAYAKVNEKLLQPWNGEKVLALSDVPKDFKYEQLKEPSTGSGSVKKLYRDEFTIPVSEMPKFIIQTNFSFEITDGGLKRRIIPIEFSDFFTRAGGVDVYFGCHFPNGWTKEDWAEFDHLIHTGIQLYMQADCKLTPSQLSFTGWLKQFEQTYGRSTRVFIEDYVDHWTTLINIPTELFKNQYDAFCAANYINEKFKISSIQMNRALKEWCAKNEIDFNPNYCASNNGRIQKFRRFEKVSRSKG